MRRWWLLVCALALGLAGEARAEGAVAIGTTGDVAKDGYSIGIASNFPSAEAARKEAMNKCASNGSKETAAQCKVFSDFHNQCAAEAQDPDPGTPGFGWAVAAGEEEAGEHALANCRQTAGDDRQDFCKVVTALCDGKR